MQTPSALPNAPRARPTKRCSRRACRSRTARSGARSLTAVRWADRKLNMLESASIQRSFPTSVGAMFAATSSQLSAQLPGWRSPLPQPERRTVTNPFTGGAIPNTLTRDPGPLTRPPVPSSLTFSCVVLPSREDWEENYLALDLALSGEPPLSQETWDDGWLAVMFNRGLCVEPLFGGGDDVGDTKYLYEVPARMVNALCDLRQQDVNVVAAAWLARCRDPADTPDKFLIRFAELAHRSVEIQGTLFTWNIVPLHRDRCG